MWSFFVWSPFWFACYSTGDNLFTMKPDKLDMTRSKSDVISHSSIMESEPSSESFVCTFSQLDECFTNVDLVMFDDEFEGNFWEFEAPCSSHSTKNKSQGNKSWSVMMTYEEKIIILIRNAANNHIH